MEDRQLEARLLELAFTTEVPITASSLAFFAPCALSQAEALLDRLATIGTLRIESDDEGQIYYVLPNRQKLSPGDQALAKRAPARPTGHGQSQAQAQAARQAAFAPTVPLVSPVMNVSPAAPLVHVPRAAAPEASDPTALIDCPFCAEPIRAAARKCKHCGEMLDAALRHAPQPVQVNVQNVQTFAPPQQAMVLADRRALSPGVAAVLAFLWPGSGHLYAGKIGTGLLWTLFTIMGYVAFVIPGMMLHVLGIFSAANAVHRENALRAQQLLAAGPPRATSDSSAA
jgi:TM2 domain-containing membrane protein YozV